MICTQCDGRPIPLPSLQGIAVLNIPSYAGGTNFWGGTKEDDVSTEHVCLSLGALSLSVCLPALLTPRLSQTFTAPSFDDKILEVVAVFGSMQMVVSRVINLQHHRIAQVRPSVWLSTCFLSVCVSSCVTLSLWLSVGQWRLPSSETKVFQFRWMGRRGSSPQVISRSSTRTGPRPWPVTEWVLLSPIHTLSVQCVTSQRASQRLIQMCQHVCFRHLRAPWSLGRTNRSASFPVPPRPSPTSPHSQRLSLKRRHHSLVSLVRQQERSYTGNNDHVDPDDTHCRYKLIFYHLIKIKCRHSLCPHRVFMKCLTIHS